ncbi:MAG: hypothetical protein AB1403_01765 [Candidatus Riflebacteria bacterium]
MNRRIFTLLVAFLLVLSSISAQAAADMSQFSEIRSEEMNVIIEKLDSQLENEQQVRDRFSIVHGSAAAADVCTSPLSKEDTSLAEFGLMLDILPQFMEQEADFSYSNENLRGVHVLSVSGPWNPMIDHFYWKSNAELCKRQYLAQQLIDRFISSVENFANPTMLTGLRSIVKTLKQISTDQLVNNKYAGCKGDEVVDYNRKVLQQNASDIRALRKVIKVQLPADQEIKIRMKCLNYLNNGILGNLFTYSNPKAASINEAAITVSVDSFLRFLEPQLKTVAKLAAKSGDEALEVVIGQNARKISASLTTAKEMGVSQASRYLAEIVKTISEQIKDLAN